MVLLNVFVGVMLPLIVLAGFGAMVGRRASLPVAPLSSVVFNLFTPALVFTTIVTVDIDADLVPRIAGVVAGVMIISGLLGVAVARGIGATRQRASAIGLSAGVINLGNMGLPLSGLAFGAEGLAVGVVAFITGSIVNNSFGIVLASLGESRSVRGALLAPLKVPAVWALAPAFAIRLGGWDPGVWLMAPTQMLADGAIPLMLVVLGLQVVSSRAAWRDLGGAVLPSVIRLVVGPTLAYLLTGLLGLDGTVRATLVVLGGMPPAVIGTIIASRYGTDPSFVARTAMVATTVSFLTLTVLIVLLG